MLYEVITRSTRSSSKPSAVQVDHASRRNTGPEMKPGMIFTIEPMINQGKPKASIDRHDGWTARTVDNKLSAQFEHTVLVTPTGFV